LIQISTEFTFLAEKMTASDVYHKNGMQCDLSTSNWTVKLPEWHRLKL